MKALLLLNLIVPLVMLLVSFQLRKYPVSDMHHTLAITHLHLAGQKFIGTMHKRLLPTFFNILGKYSSLSKSFCALCGLPLILM